MTPLTRFQFSLYVADNSPNGALARRNIHELCAEHLPGRYDIEVVDVLVSPERAALDGISQTPTLLRRSPLPLVRIAGTLSHTSDVLRALGVEARIA
jgi:circadian clock protein KaiB